MFGEKPENKMYQNSQWALLAYTTILDKTSASVLLKIKGTKSWIAGSRALMLILKEILGSIVWFLQLETNMMQAFLAEEWGLLSSNCFKQLRALKN